MAIFNLFSKRQKRLRGEVPDVYQYEDIPHKLRVQIVHIIDDAFDSPKRKIVAEIFNYIHKTLCKEYGVFQLKEYAKSDYDAIFSYFLECNDHERVLDIIELCFRLIDTPASISPDNAINELNARFKEHGVGYQFESGELRRVDSQFIHSEVVRPVLALLGQKKHKYFQGANQEFLKAHEHYRHSRHQECLNECLKAFESVMKAICEKRGWSYNQTDTASTLINICLEKELIPRYLQSQISSMQNLLVSGVPAIRNRLSAHGKGVHDVQLNNSIVSYALHLTATNILYLMNCEMELK